MTSRRLRPGRKAQLFAIAGLVFLGLTLAAAVYAAVDRFPLDLVAVLLIFGAALVGLRALMQRGLSRAIGVFAAALLAAGSFVLMLSVLKPVVDLLTVAFLVLGILATRRALRYRVDLPPAPRPSLPPGAGGGRGAQ